MYAIRSQDWNRYRTSILDHHLNVAILDITNRLFPGGFDVSNDAPDTYEKLVHQFESGHRMSFMAAARNTPSSAVRKSIIIFAPGMTGAIGKVVSTFRCLENSAHTRCNAAIWSRSMAIMRIPCAGEKSCLPT
ncbi:MAG: hypothetical protein WBO55_01790 [Rhizobiaceae bacterium]